MISYVGELAGLRPMRTIDQLATDAARSKPFAAARRQPCIIRFVLEAMIGQSSKE